MGVSATGKSSVARRLAELHECDFIEGDDLHPRANVAKMEAGDPLTDEDRWPWLARVAQTMREQADAGRSSVVTCSALKRAYRDRLREDVADVWFLHLHAPAAVLEDRMSRRTRHFMPVSLLASQLATLEPLAPAEHGRVVDVTPPLDDVVAAASRALAELLNESPGA
ncbi:Thermoresistant gluconokinase [Nocardioides dokdonensis FR1436]|uniref:Gluconokinase n=2 Tax=Nocardioides TaxID=1839 RepID=A0A1A9GPE0_9ACTN|nr:Thermoresistant gluconokinase [Nocardioides dokdonensis FR1436]